MTRTDRAFTRLRALEPSESHQQLDFFADLEDVVDDGLSWHEWVASLPPLTEYDDPDRSRRGAKAMR